jgi:hypothetical protein
MKYVYDDGGRAGPAALPMDNLTPARVIHSVRIFLFFSALNSMRRGPLVPLFPMT